MADTPQSIECSSAELSHLLSNCFVSESEAILKMAENLKSILRAQKIELTVGSKPSVHCLFLSFFP